MTQPASNPAGARQGPLHGGCQCGAVRYVVRAPAEEVYHCHCQMCRKVHGAIFATFGIVPADAFTIERGAGRLSTFESSPGSRRLFCGNCGCQLLSTVESRPGVVYFAVATLDDGAHPGHPAGRERHIYVGSKVPWYEIASHLPQHEVS
jgi:hypothetical protein